MILIQRALVIVVIAQIAGAATAGEPIPDLRTVDSRVIPTDSDLGKQLPQMLARDARSRIQAANQRESAAWHAIKTRADWERYRDPRIQALRDSLGPPPPVPRDLKVRVTGTVQGDGYRVENVVFESRPGLIVTANLYAPATPPRSMPGLLIVHSHHNPKTQSELQDMGITWAKLGCLVLIMDQLGHGERRQHPFVNEKSFAGSFRAGRQDYYFRYNVALQLHVIGESLVGWMAWDLMRGVDLLLSRPGIDKERIILLGSVAGGGDPAAVTAALDPRIAAVVPFNFGGPQPETVYPLPDNAETSFNYAGGGSWESTRNLRLSARDGFLPWVIVGSMAPRRLIYGHEFAWDRERDPVWKRLETIVGFYDVRDRLSFATGRGRLSGQPPESTHCNNIGPEHRQGIYDAMQPWFGITRPERENQKRHAASELICLTPEAMTTSGPKPVHELAAALGAERASAAQQRLMTLSLEERRRQLRRDWARLLGDVEPGARTELAVAANKAKIADAVIERIALQVEPGIVVPVALLFPSDPPKVRLPIVVGVAQDGKQAFLKHRANAIADLLAGGVAVCLPDVRGTGETRPTGDGRGRASASTSISATELMLGRTLLGLRLRDLRSVLRYLRSREDLDGARIALWGESFAPVNPEVRDLQVPWDAEKLPDQAEPLGALLALFGGLYEDDVRAVYAHGGLAGYQSLLRSSFCYVPHDAVVPGALTAGDLGDVAAALAPRGIRLTGLVNGLNRRAGADEIAPAFAPARAAYRSVMAEKQFEVDPHEDSGRGAATWLLRRLKDR